MSPRAARVTLAVYLATIYATLGVVRSITDFLRDRGLVRIGVVAAFVIAGAAVLWLILKNARNRSWRVVLAMLLVGLGYAAVIYPMKSAEEKIHFIEYGGVAVLAHLAAPPRWTGRKRFIACALFVTAAGWVDEGIQALLPSRVYDLRDVAFNAAAGLMALGVVAIFSTRERKLGPDRSEEVAVDPVHGRPGRDRR